MRRATPGHAACSLRRHLPLFSGRQPLSLRQSRYGPRRPLDIDDDEGDARDEVTLASQHSLSRYDADNKASFSPHVRRASMPLRRGRALFHFHALHASRFRFDARCRFLI